MSTRIAVNEGSTSYHDISAVGIDGSVVVPESIRYRLMTSEGVEVVAWTTVDSQTTRIEIAATNNIIGTTGKQRYLTVEITHNGGKKITEEVNYTLVNLKGIVAS